MIFQDYIIPETQKEKFALAIKLAKDFEEKYVVMRESPRIRIKNHLPVEGGVKKMVAFFESIGLETMVVFLRSIGHGIAVKLMEIPEFREKVKTIMIHYANKEPMMCKVVRAKEISDDGEIIPWEKGD